MRENKGITLVALVVTIIVLIILAGVSINMMFGENGIFSKAEIGTQKYDESAAKEEMEAKILGIYTKSITEEQRVPDLQYLSDGLCADDEVEYVELESKLAQLTPVNVTGYSKIFVKLKAYMYEFEIGDGLQILGITELDNGNSRKVTLSYDANGGSGAPESTTIENGKTVTVSNIVPNIEDKNKEFIGWTDNKNSNEVKYFAGDEITLTKNKTIYAVWTTLSQEIGHVTQFDYTGEYQTFKAGDTGYYKIECWGASGGADWYEHSIGGKGGYTSGEIKLNKDQIIYIYVGEEGSKATTTYNGRRTKASFNGGGSGSGSTDSDDGGGSGGGATDIRINLNDNELDWDNENGLKKRIMVAGGGAGGSYIATGIARQQVASGGGLTGVGSIWGYNNREVKTHSYNATQTSGYSFGIGQNGYCAANGGGRWSRWWILWRLCCSKWKWIYHCSK